MDGHDTAVTWADEVVPGSTVDVTAWTWRATRSGRIRHYHAEGPCPRCGASGQSGHLALTAAPLELLDGEDLPEPPAEVEVRVTCRCGAPHGQDGASGCGRAWSIVGPGRGA